MPFLCICLVVILQWLSRHEAASSLCTPNEQHYAMRFKALLVVLKYRCCDKLLNRRICSYLRVHVLSMSFKSLEQGKVRNSAYQICNIRYAVSNLISAALNWLVFIPHNVPVCETEYIPPLRIVGFSWRTLRDQKEAVPNLTFRSIKEKKEWLKRSYVNTRRINRGYRKALERKRHFKGSPPVFLPSIRHRRQTL